jgi:hypothetical protein
VTEPATTQTSRAGLVFQHHEPAHTHAQAYQGLLVSVGGMARLAKSMDLIFQERQPSS